MNDNRFTLRFSGVADLKPQALRAKELAEILENIETAVAATVVAHEPKIKREQIALSLVAVTDESVGLTFVPNLQSLTFPALEKITSAITTHHFGTLSGPAIKSLRAILRFVRERGCNVELKLIQDNQEIYAALTPDTHIHQTSSIRGQTTIHGDVIRVGGVEPKVEIKTIDGKVLVCATTQQIALQLAERLYQQVAVAGTAFWNPETLEIEEFEISGVLSYVKVDLPQVFRQLREQTQNIYGVVGDVEKYIHNLRYDEE
ncbi:MAG: hypothetical protein U0175_37270 [Caldilineaceae bacterium]